VWCPRADSFKRWLDGRVSIAAPPETFAHFSIGEEPTAVIAELLSLDASSREAVHLPRLAQQATSSPVLGALTLVVSHWTP
jgi:hypothetical protein